MAEEKKPKNMQTSDSASEGKTVNMEEALQKQEKEGKKAWQDPDFDEKPHVPARSTGLLALASLLLFVACLFFVRFEVNRIGSVTVSEGSYLTEAQISAIIGTPNGKYLPSLDTEKMEERIKALSPMVADVSFELSLSRRLRVQIIDEEYAYYYRTENGATLLLNADFKALAYHPKDSCKKKDCPYEKGMLTELYIQAPEEITVGEVLSFDGKDELSSFVAELNGKKGSLYKKLNLLDIRNARHIVFIFDSLVCVELSDHSDLDVKCLAIEKMMAKRQTREEAIETRFTYVDPISGSIYWAVEEWANLYEDYPNPDRP
ncbi:MAG: FtsQ-type POTRA domain-containing protein [Clostridia bacterium]|nr:FtsQ-type POTRA domain-containing protein [Clostridia bacterium]